MAVFKTNLTAEMEDGTNHEVVADQRDMAAWEGQDFHSDKAYTVRVRFLAYNALRRTKVFKSTWQRFNDECVEVRVNTETAGDDVDPTNQDLSDED
jgi:hypothetical protein